MCGLSQIFLFVTVFVLVSGNSEKNSSYTEERQLQEMGLDVLRHQLSREKKGADLKGIAIGEFRLITDGGISHFIVYALLSNGDFKIVGFKNFNVDMEEHATTTRQPSQEKISEQTSLPEKASTTTRYQESPEQRVKLAESSHLDQPAMFEPVQYPTQPNNLTQKTNSSRSVLNKPEKYIPDSSPELGAPETRYFPPRNFEQSNSSRERDSFSSGESLQQHSSLAQVNNLPFNNFTYPTQSSYLDRREYTEELRNLEEDESLKSSQRQGQSKGSESFLKGLLSRYLEKIV